jgi:hypothetical protein
MSTHDPEAADDYSKLEGPRTIAPGPLGVVGSVLAALGFAGVVLAFAATFSTVIKVQVLTVTTASYSGYDRNSVALILLGVFGLLMLAGGLRGSRPALLALGLVGLAVLLIAVLHDLPHLNDSGVWPLHDQYEDAQASAGAGYYLETASGVLLLLSGVGLALLGPRRQRSPRGRRTTTAPARPVPDDWFAGE